MLTPTTSTISSTKTQHIMRRRARNLRAKVRALLPVQVCCKHHQRNRCIRDIAHNKQLWQCAHAGRTGWHIGAFPSHQQYYQEGEEEGVGLGRFGKLTHSEIEQIKQDRLYYLGEGNLEEFQRFLDGWQGEKLVDRDCHLAKSMKKLVDLPTPHTGSFRPPLLHKSNKDKISVEDKLREFSQRRKFLIVEQKSKTLMDKVKLNMKLQRAQQKLKQIQNKKLAELQTRKMQKQQQLRKISHRKRNQQESGEIKQLQQQLRRNFINRMARTAQQWSRPKNLRV